MRLERILGKSILAVFFAAGTASTGSILLAFISVWEFFFWKFHTFWLGLRLRRRFIVITTGISRPM